MEEGPGRPRCGSRCVDAARRTGGGKQLEAWEQREIKRRAPPPEPVTSLVGARESLRFGPALPDGRKTLLPRQPRGRFDAAARSKLLDQFMEKPRLGRSQNVDRTEPVPWCKTGGVVTHVAAPRKKASRVHAELVKEIDAAKKAFVRDLAQNNQTTFLVNRKPASHFSAEPFL